jgi:FkbM family methyltransferase
MTISGADFLKRVTYRPEVKALARALGLGKTLRGWYFRCALPSNGIVEHQVGGVTGRFYIRTPGELRNLDPAGCAQREQKILELLIASVQEGDVFFDVGANVGLYTVMLAKAVGKRGQVIAFEPMRESFAHLQDNLILNGLTNVRCFQNALGESAGEAKLYLGEENADSSLVGHPAGKDLGWEAVSVVRGDEFVEAKNLPSPRVVKVDVEGYEYAALQGLKRTLAAPGCRLVCCEVHPRLLPPDVKPQSVFALLRSLGFVHIGVSRRGDTYHAICRKTCLPGGGRI